MKVMMLSSTILVCLIICEEKFPVFYNKPEEEKKYKEGNGRILRLVNSFLHESLFLLPVIILLLIIIIIIQHHHTKFLPRFSVYVSYFSTQATGNTYRQREK